VVEHGTGTRARQGFTVFGKTGTTNGSTDAWFTGCIPSQHVCVSTWMGYERSSCEVDKGLEIDGPCGGMKDVHGVRQVYGGTLPAKIFDVAQDELRRIKAERAARAAGTPLPSPSAEPTRKPRPDRSSAAPEPVRTRAPSRTPSPTPPPAPTSAPPTPPVIIPTAPPPSPSPSGAPP